MTIPATPRRSPVYVGNGVSTDYAFGFKVLDPETVVVTVADENDLNLQVLQYLVDYTVTLNPDQDSAPGGEVQYADLPVGHRLVVTSDTESSQPTSITNLGAFHANVLEDALDRLAILHQQQQEQLDRAVKVTITSEDDPSTLLDSALTQAANSAAAALASEQNAAASEGNASTSEANALASEQAAYQSADEAEDWANKTGGTVDGSEYSAKHYASEAAGAAVGVVSAFTADLASTVDSNKGAALVGVLSPLAGAVGRSVGAALGDTVSVRDFGAVGDGATDDTAAFIAAIAAVAGFPFGGRVHVPAGVYRLTTSLDIPTYVTIEGDGRWSTRLAFEGSFAVCVNLAGADTNDKRQSVLRGLRIDGTKCTHATAVGVLCNWNQSQSPLLDEVTIYGGYEAEGAGTGLSTGLGFVASGNNWIVDFSAVAVEGCRTTGLTIDASPVGYANIINFFGSRFENCKGRNVYVKGPGDGVSSLSINFAGCTIEGASFQTTGVNEDVLVDGAGVNFSNCWFESHASPNWPTYEVNILGVAWVNFHSCNWAWSQYAVNVRGRVTFSGLNTIRSGSGAIIVADGGRLNLSGDVAFLGAGTPVQSNDSTGRLDWSRDTLVPKTASGTLSTGEFGATISNDGALSDVTLTLPNGVDGASYRVVNSGVPLVGNPLYEWRPSGSGTGEYYLTLVGGGNPNCAEPTKVYSYGAERSKNTLGSLAINTWGYGNNDSLGFSTLYFRDGGNGDPDSLTKGTVVASWKVTITPSNNQRIVPLGTGPSDSIVSDGVPGSAVRLRNVAKSFWLIEERTGAWA